MLICLLWARDSALKNGRMVLRSVGHETSFCGDSLTWRVAGIEYTEWEEIRRSQSHGWYSEAVSVFGDDAENTL
jgi:hypothetical protein